MIYKFITENPLKGTLKIPSSKSISHRAVIAAALAEGVSTLTGVLDSVDLTATIGGLEALGATIERGSVTTIQGGLKGKGGVIDCHESGSTIRFLIPISLLTGKSYTFLGKGKLPERPLQVYADLFKEKGIEYVYSGTLPFTCCGPIRSGHFQLPGDVSSQFITGLLYTLPLLEGDSYLEIVNKFESKPYVDLTVEMLAQFGIRIEAVEKGYTIKGGQTYRGSKVTIEGDYSQSAFWIVAALLKGDLILEGLNPLSKQGDKAIVDLVLQMGGQLTTEGSGIRVIESITYGCVIDAAQIPDLVPILAVLAALSQGETRIINAERVRIKESDRLKAIATELKKMGANITETPDGLTIQGVKQLKGAQVDAWNDHRIAMALTVASLRAEGETILTGAEAVTKSYPHFFEDFKAVGGVVVE